MKRSTFKVLFYVKRPSENRVRFPSWVISPSTVRCRSSVANSPYLSPCGIPKPTRPRVRASKPGASTRSWKISRPISVNNTSVSVTGIRMLLRKKSAMPSWVWVMIVACCYKPSMNILRSSASVWARIALIPPMRITACGASVLPLSSNMNTTSRTFLSKS